MRKLLLMICTTLFLGSVKIYASVYENIRPYNHGINVIPMPNFLSQQEGSFMLSKTNNIYSNTKEGKKIAELLIQKMQSSTGFSFNTIKKEDEAVIKLIIDKKLNFGLEEYKLVVSKNGIEITAKTPNGLFYGYQTLLQLLPAEIENRSLQSNLKWEIPYVIINDAPRFSYRGVMLDPCRHFITVENLKKEIDVLSMFKINTLHLHLTDDQGWRLEIKKYPKLAEIGSKRLEGEGFEYNGFYTQDEMKDIVKYAQERFITIVPELEMPGHEMAAIAAYPHLSCKEEETSPRIIWGVEDVVMCPGKENMFIFLEDVIKEMTAIFPGTYFHVGGDECPKTSWKKCKKCQERIKKENLFAIDKHSAEERLQSYVIQRMEKVLAKYGKKIIGWDEILEGGLSPNATVMSWRGEEGGIAAALQSHDVIMTPGGNGMYLDHYQGDSKIEPVAIGGYTTLKKTYSYNPVPDTLRLMNKEHYVKGVQCNIWSEYMYTNNIMEYRMYPRTIALSEIAWTQLNKKDYKDFERRINNAYVRLDAHNINYHIPQPEQPGGSVNFIAFTDYTNVEFTTSRPIKMVYTTDGSEPNENSSLYITPLHFIKSTILKIRSLLDSGKMSPTRTIKIEKQEYSPSKKVYNLVNGLSMRMTYGTFLKSSDLEKASRWKNINIEETRDIRSQVNSTESMRGVKQYSAIANGYINIDEDGVYFFSSNNDEVWIDGKLIVNNQNEVKRFSRNDGSIALAKGLHEIKIVFLGHIIGGWPSIWDDASINIRESKQTKFTPISKEKLFRAKQ